MTEAFVLSLAKQTVTIALMLAGPILLISLLVGSLISLIQAATQINEVTMTFIPKMVGIILVILILGSWMLQQLMIFTSGLFNQLPSLVH